MIKFGTSGFRGMIGEGFTEENITKIAYALSQIIKEDKIKNPKISVGYDNRLMGKEIANLVAKFFASQKIEVLTYSKSVPSPLVTFDAKTLTYGFMITASHNPANYNGVKIFLNPGKESDDEFCKRLENIANNVNYEDIKTLHKTFNKELIKKTKNISTYCNSIVKLVNKEAIKKRNLKVLFNAMNGSSVDCINQIASDLNMTNYEIMNANIDTYFGGKVPAPYKYNLVEQSKLVKKNFDFGIAFDGDGDRISVIDKDGTIYDCNYIFPVIYNHFLGNGYAGDIVKNTALSNLAKIIAEKRGFHCYESKVGFKHIGKILETTNAFLGGESNGIAFKEHIFSKDGLLIAFLLIDMLSIQKETFKQTLTALQKKYNFKSEVVEYAYPITAEQKQALTKLIFEEKQLPNSKLKIESTSYIDGLKITYQKGYWAVIRFSGNENVVRLFAEMPTLKKCNKLIALFEKYLNLKTRQI